MRRGRVFIFLALIIIVGMVIAFFVFNGTPSVGTEPTPTPDMVNIITAGQNIAQGEQITEDMLSTMPVPRDQRLETTFTDDQIGEMLSCLSRLRWWTTSPGRSFRPSFCSAAQRETSLPARGHPGRALFRLTKLLLHFLPISCHLLRMVFQMALMLILLLAS